MKLKPLTYNDNRLNRLLDYVKSIDFTKSIYKGSIFYGNYKNDNIYLHIDDTADEEQVRETLINIIKKWWSNFESGMEFHTYAMDDYFVEVKQLKNDTNVWEFKVEAMDDSVYFVFNTNFVVNL